jgi:hypothetical protein
VPAPATEEEGVALVMRARVNWSGVELVFSGRKRGEGVRPRCEPAGPPQTRQAGEPAGAESAACFSFFFSFYLYIKNIWTAEEEPLRQKLSIGRPCSCERWKNEYTPLSNILVYFHILIINPIM